jgi:hypothetical protein
MTRTYDDFNLEPLVKLIETARALTEPSEPNGEYIRGQVSLINDYTGLPGEADNYYDILTDVIAHRISVPEFLFLLGGRLAGTGGTAP